MNTTVQLGANANAHNNNTSQNNGKQNAAQGNKPHGKIHIFVNNIKYSEDDGVKTRMSGRDLAALVPVPPENADITRKNSDEAIGIDEVIDIKVGDHFEIIRKQVHAGFRW